VLAVAEVYAVPDEPAEARVARRFEGVLNLKSAE
jgi:hypothetical protein